MKEEFNATSDNSFVKTTINIRNRMMMMVHQRMAELHKESFVDYLRDLIAADLKHRILGAGPTVSLTTFRQQVNWPKKETEREALDRIKARGFYRNESGQLDWFANDPPRKYSGFVSGLCRSSMILQWFRKRNIKAKPGR